LKTGEITDLGQYRHGGNEINPAHRLQGRDDLGKRPFGRASRIACSKRSTRSPYWRMP